MFGVVLIVLGAIGVLVGLCLPVLAVGIVISATGVSVCGAVFYAAGEIVSEMRLLAEWHNAEAHKRAGRTEGES